MPEGWSLDEGNESYIGHIGAIALVLRSEVNLEPTKVPRETLVVRKVSLLLLIIAVCRKSIIIWMDRSYIK